MAENSKIEWCDDTVNFWWGCTRYGEGCRSCYAEKLSKRSGNFWGPAAPRLYIKTAAAECIRLNRKAEREGKPRIVFVNSMSDFFEDHDGPIVTRDGKRLCMFDGHFKGASPTANICCQWATLNDLRNEAFELFDECSWLRFLILTKRPENIRRMWVKNTVGEHCRKCGASAPLEPDDIREEHFELDDHDDCWQCIDCKVNASLYRPNCWLGISIANQDDADRNIPLLLKCRDLAPVLFVSAEPLIGPVDFRWKPYHHEATGETYREYLGRVGTVDEYESLRMLDLLICGGESGHGARPMHPQWARDLRDQCNTAGVAFFFKQWGCWVEDKDSPSPRMVLKQTAFGPMRMPESRAIRVVRRDGRDCVFNGDGTFTGDSPKPEDAWMVKCDKKVAGRLLDGRTWDEMPTVEAAR